jgi:putative MFS transporter
MNTHAAAGSSTVYAASRLDRLPLSTFHVKLLFLIGAGLFLDTFDLYLGGAVTGTLLKEGWSTLKLNATFGTMTFVGLLIGAWTAGILGDRFGRRFSFQINLAIFGSASIAAAFAPSMYWLIGIRLFMGIGLGAEIVVAYSMLAEFVPPKYRGRLLALLGLFANSSVFIATFVSLWVIPHFGWRPLFAGVGITAVVIWALRKSMPESPRWLEENGRHAEAEATLRMIESKIGDGRTLPDYERKAPVLTQKPSSAVLFSREVLPRTLLGCLIMMVIGFSVYGFLGWLPSFFVKQGRSIVQSLTWSTIISLGGPAGNIVGFLVAERMGRKPAIVAATLSGSVFGIMYLFAASDVALLTAGFLLVSSVYFLVAIGQGIYVPELFATSYRLRGAGLCGTAGRAASAACQFFVLWLFNLGGVSFVVGAVVAAMLLLAIAVLTIGVETRGRRLEEISPERIVS